MQSKFNPIAKAELRADVLEHRDDKEISEALADRIYANPNPQCYDPEDVDKIVDLIRSQQAELSIENNIKNL